MKKMKSLTDNTAKRFRAGKFKIGDIEKASLFAESLALLRPFLIGSPDRDREFLRALAKVYAGIEPERLLEKFMETGEKLTREVNETEYLRRLEDIANYKVKTKIRFY